MTLIQLNALTFSSEGNVASMNTLMIAGSVSQYMIDFPPKGLNYYLIYYFSQLILLFEMGDAVTSLFSVFCKIICLYS